MVILNRECLTHQTLQLKRMISDTEISNALRQDHKGDQLSVQNIPPSLTSKNSTSIYPGPTKKCQNVMESAKLELKPQNFP